MPLPTGPNSGGLPQRPGAGLPPRPGSGQPPVAPQRPVAPQMPQPEQQLPPVQAPQQIPPVAPNERLSQYDFEAQRVDRPTARQPQQEQQYSAPQEWDSEPEPQVDPYEAQRLEEVRARRERETAERFDRSMEQREPAGKIKNNVLTPQAGELDEKGQNVFVDKKEKKVKPFGGKKSSLKVSDLDRRKNMRQNARIVQIFVIGLVVLTLGFAVKNAFFPPASLTTADVEGIVYNTTNTTAFPLEKGRFYAETFMEAYLEYNPDDPASSAVMQYYTLGKLAAGGTAPGLTIKKGWTQDVVYGPVTYQSQGATANSAVYTIGALVEVSATGDGTTSVSTPPATDTTTETEGSGTAEETSTTNTETPSSTNTTTTTDTGGRLMWQYFSVNVYYDTENDSFAIVSYPTIVPNPSVTSATDIPKAAIIGTGEPAPQETVAAITPTVYGFMEAFRVSSADDFSKLLPFLPADPDTALLKGLGGIYDFKGGAANDKSISMETYTTDTTDIKVVLTVTWTQTVGGLTTENLSQYVATVTPLSGGYDITRFVPLAFIPQATEATN